MVTKLNDSWEKIIEKYNILNEVKENGFFVITAKQIKEFREPRLMTKFDHKEDLPQIFKDNNLSIMPISRDEFYISNHQMFKRLDNIGSKIKRVYLPNYIKSIQINNIFSESVALNCSYLTGMINDFVNDINVFPTVNGRMSSKTFNFKIENLKTKKSDEVKVENSQIEIDGAFEGVKYLTLVEAKKTMCDNFLIRQLYYPFRLWKSKIDKEIRLVYFIYSNDVFYFFEYQFQDPNNYNSLKLIKQINYTLENVTIDIIQVQNVLHKVIILKEPNLPFPQADNFYRIINLCEFVKDEPKPKREITIHYAFTDRQTDYYGNACEYLGLIEKVKKDDNICYMISKIGKAVLEKNYGERQLAFVERILQHKVFNTCLNHYFNKGELSKEKIVEIMKESNLYNVGIKGKDSTYGRRASTIRGWIDWIIGLVQE